MNLKDKFGGKKIGGEKTKFGGKKIGGKKTNLADLRKNESPLSQCDQRSML
jgi:hypothetical protein